MKFTRAEVNERLQAQVDSGKALLMFGAGTGLTAKCAEAGGADLIGVYSTAIFRMQGIPSILAWLPYTDCNEELMKMSKEILPSVKKTPCIAGMGAHHPAIDFEDMINRLKEMGFSGINNEPFSGMYGDYFASQLEKSGVGFSREVELIRTANKMDFFSVAWAMSPDEAARMAEAGADVIGAMIGVTSGGMSGAKGVISVEEATEKVQEMIDAAWKEKPGVKVLTHGGPFADVDTAQYSILHSDAVGYASGSSGERIPTERAVVAITEEYKNMRIK
jgi:predicted TIM-barrel enzyme